MKSKIITNKNYQFGFHSNVHPTTIFKRGLSETIVRQISQIKHEPEWMLNIRLKAYRAFKKLKNPTWGPNLEQINFNEYIYYSVTQDVSATNKEFKKLNVVKGDGTILSGSNAQYDSEVVYHDLIKELQEKKVIFTTIEEAMVKYPKLVRTYFGTLVSCLDNKYAALNTAVWSGGSFIYVPKNVKLKRPLQAYFRINTKSVGQFERTLIIADEKAQVHYVEGCTAPIYAANNLHAAVVEVFVHKNALVRYSTIQNWSDNVLNLVTKRCRCDANATMEWIDGNLGSKLNMKYPATILAGNNAKARCISIAVAHQNVIQDTGAKMIHIGKNTRSQIISKSIAHSGGNATYRGLIEIKRGAHNSYSEVTCDSLILDKTSKSDTIPTEIIRDSSSYLKHEAKITDIDKEKLFYLNTKGINLAQAKHLLVLGFIGPFVDELPMEYAVELNRLLKADLNS